MQTIRTTITLPQDLHEDLRIEAIKKKTSFNKLIINKLEEPKKNTKKFKVRAFDMGKVKSLRRKDFYDDILK